MTDTGKVATHEDSMALHEGVRLGAKHSIGTVGCENELMKGAVEGNGFG